MKRLISGPICIYLLFNLLFLGHINPVIGNDIIKFKGFYINMDLNNAINIVKKYYHLIELNVNSKNGLCVISLDPYCLLPIAFFKYDSKFKVKYISLDKKLVNELFNVNDMSGKDFVKMFIKAYKLPERYIIDDSYRYTSPERHRISIFDKDVCLEKIPGSLERKFD